MTDGALLDGLVIVDKPAGWTSHDVVGRIRKLAGTRRVGHAGTLDPMATGVLILGLNKATRLLGHLALKDKAYDAVIRLGITTTTDDADGETVAARDTAGVTDEAITRAIADLTGDIQQIPSSVSAIKVDGVRAYKRVRDGETVELKARPVTVSHFDVTARDGADLSVMVECTTGTYIRALARDLGEALGTGAHLVSLRRTRVGSFDLSSAHTIEELAERLDTTPLATAVDMTFPRIDVTAEEAQRIGFGQRLVLEFPGSPAGVFGPDGNVIALVEDRQGVAQPLCVFA